MRLEPLGARHTADFERMVDDDDVRAFTMVPTQPSPTFVSEWIGRYEEAWLDGSRAGFAILDDGGQTVGFAAIFGLAPGAAEGEIGYFVGACARGRGIATSCVRLLTDWGFGELGLVRLELRIDTQNVASERVAERCGYRREGVLRCKYFKEGLRTDVAVWSRLRTD